MMCMYKQSELFNLDGMLLLLYQANYNMFYQRAGGYSSVVEHLTADQEVPGSNPGVPCTNFFFPVQIFFSCGDKIFFL